MGDAGLCVGVLSTFVSARNMILKRDPEDFVRICAEQLTNGEHVTCSCAYSVPTNLSPAAKEVVVFPAEWALLDEIRALSCQIENSERANRLFFGQFEKNQEITRNSLAHASIGCG